MTGSGKPAEARAQAAAAEAAPAILSLEGCPRFAFAEHLDRRDGLPVADWDAVWAWMDRIPEPENQMRAWSAAEQAWLLHVRDALGAGFRLDQNEGAAVLSSLEPKLARYVLEFMERTLNRIVRVLDGVAQVPPLGKDLLIVFDDQETYYRYASRYYPERGEFAFSSGMHISRGCSHYITTKSDLRSIEPVIAHEMTHGCVGHLPLPLWVNEGLAVNTEHSLAGAGAPLHTPHEMHAKHLKFWGAAEMQEFWSGKSFGRPDDGSMLSYELGRVLVEQFSQDWPRFAAFANAAHFEDGGAAAAREHLGIELGAAVAAILEKEDPAACEPQPKTWDEPAEHAPAEHPLVTAR